MAKKYQFLVSISSTGKAHVTDKKGKEIKTIKTGNLRYVKLVPIVIGIPTGSGARGGNGHNGGGCNYPCHPGIVMGRWGCICP